MNDGMGNSVDSRFTIHCNTFYRLLDVPRNTVKVGGRAWLLLDIEADLRGRELAGKLRGGFGGQGCDSMLSLHWFWVSSSLFRYTGYRIL